MRRVHADAGVGGTLSQSRCGQLGVDVSHDAASVTCRLCTRIMSGRSRARTPPREPFDAGQALLEAVEPLMVQTASAPPRFDPYTWATCCRVEPETQAGRCGACMWCQHERELDTMHAASPWREGSQLREEGTRDYEFSSVNHAITIYAEHRQRDHSDGSALGDMLSRAEMGLGKPTGQRQDHDPRSARRVLRHVDLARAFDGICHGELAAPIPRELAIAIVLVRCPGVQRGGHPPTYPDICEQLLQLDYSVTPRQLKRVNRLARRELIVELVSRGLLRQPLDLDHGMLEAIEARTRELDARGAAA